MLVHATPLCQPHWSFPTICDQELPAGTDESGMLPWGGPLVSVSARRSQLVAKPRLHFSPEWHCGQCPHRCGRGTQPDCWELCNSPTGDPKSYAYGFSDTLGPHHALYIGATALLAARGSGSARLDSPTHRSYALITCGSLKGQSLPCYSD